ncbi:DNA repair protein RadA [Mesoaciditoga lauensis]|uniref:DNA repair protein RadA n=1 Tax=Mesoaciditoga lauensis TaxID=1495039 RepID=UPI0005606D4C|nr:DNA repair protein RadA [Mesoaciditoga lauensis]
MKREKDKIYVCSNCGYTSAKWFGRCPQCGEWNTAVEVEGAMKKAPSTVEFESSKSSIAVIERLKTNMHEMDRVLGGGLTPGSVVLVAGGPGIGKSTLLLQYASALAEKGSVYYISGEESVSQILTRVKRLKADKGTLFLSSSVEVDSVFSSIKKKPIAMVFDSIQTLHTSGMNALTGSVSQMRECTVKLVEYAKSTNTPIFIIGHITKIGNIAGPMVLEHMVDTVLYLEGEPRSGRRILRSIKNRFGPTDEIAVYEMNSNGMAEIPDPSRIFADMDSEEPGNALSVVVEGSRSLLVNVQTLATFNRRSSPIRIARGIENSRLLMLSALTSNYLGVHLENNDLYLNILGGLKVTDPAVDLAVVAALYSSSKKMHFPIKTVFVGEVGLDGRIRPVPQMKMRVSEAKRMGIKRIITSYYSKEKDTIGVKTVREAITKALAGDE